MRELRLIGHVEVWSQEGGYAAPDVTVGGESVAHRVQKLFQETLPDFYEGKVPGEYELILRQLK